MRKQKLNLNQQIEHMKHKGIKFELIGIDEAKHFLGDNTYFFKIKAYAKNYNKNTDGHYVNLDFAYLKELSVLDMRLKQTILKRFCRLFEKSGVAGATRRRSRKNVPAAHS
jgi:hypothetical protein